MLHTHLQLCGEHHDKFFHTATHVRRELHSSHMAGSVLATQQLATESLCFFGWVCVCDVCVRVYEHINVTEEALHSCWSSSTKKLHGIAAL